MTPEQEKTLETIAEVQYMTINQMLDFSIFNASSTARRHLKNLVSSGFLNVHNFGVQVGVGKLPSLYGLTPKGVRYLADNLYLEPSSIKASKSNRKGIKAPRDFHHRTGLIDSLLSIFSYLDSIGVHERWSELYFRKHGEHAPKRTRIDFDDGSRLEADAILHFEDTHQKRRFYLIEFYEDSDQVERVRRSVLKHAEAIATGKPSEALGLNVGHRVLCIFRHEHTARAIVRYLKEPAFEQIQDRYLITTLEAIKKDPLKNWIDGTGSRNNLL